MAVSDATAGANRKPVASDVAGQERVEKQDR
jgi:hypothetical protein